jgi:hypothetical protein
MRPTHPATAVTVLRPWAVRPCWPRAGRLIILNLTVATEFLWFVFPLIGWAEPAVATSSSAVITGTSSKVMGGMSVM